MRDLHTHGFLSIELNDTLTNICEVLPHARDIPRIGAEQLVQGEKWRFFDRSLSADTTKHTLVGYNMGELYREGTYGRIYKASRMVVVKRPDDLFDVETSPHEVIVKMTYPSIGIYLQQADITSHTSEGLLHILSWRIMQETATPWAIPRPYEIFGEQSPTRRGWRSMFLGMSYVRGRILQTFFEKNWKESTLVENTHSFCEIIGQTAYILHHLQMKMRLNHRDVKVNNLLVRPSKDIIVLELNESYMPVTMEVTLIDFGFACVGCPPPKKPDTVLQAGSWFPFNDMCCKKGRDIAQLIYCIQCYFPLEKYLTPEFYKVVAAWMMIPWSGGVANALEGFSKAGIPSGGKAEYHTGIYEFLRRADVDPETCEPAAIFAACCANI